MRHLAQHPATVRFSGVDSFRRDGAGPEVVLREGGAIELLGPQGEVLRRVDLYPGDTLAVSDGQAVDAGTELVLKDPWNEAVFAELPARREDGSDGEVVGTFYWHWPPACEQSVDPVTGQTVNYLRSDAPAAEFIVESDGRVHQHGWARPGDRVYREKGDPVRRGDLLVSRPRPRRPAPQPGGDLGRLHDLLAPPAGAPHPRPRARLAEHPGVVRLRADRRSWVIAVRGAAGQVQVLRTSSGDDLAVSTGDTVDTGDALTSGSRSHRDLLRLWGAARFAAHAGEELERLFALSPAPIDTRALDLVVRPPADRDEPGG